MDREIVKCNRLLEQYPAIVVFQYFTEEVFIEAVYLVAETQWAFIDMGRTWIDDIVAGKFTVGDLPQKKQKKKPQEDTASSKGITKKGKFRQAIDSKITISDLAKEYFPNHKIKGELMQCPFHDDKTPSLSFNDSKNIFKCWGCGITGDIVEFYRRILENGKGKYN